MTLRLPELCSYPQELRFSLSTSSHPPPQPSTSKLSGCCLLRSEAEWGDLAPFLSLFFFFFLKSTHVYAPNLCTLCFSTSRHKLNPGLMRTGSPLCTCSEGEGGRQREQKKREREREHEEWRGNDFLIFYTGFVVLEGCLYVFFKSIGENKRRGDCAIHCLRAMLSLYI